MYDLIVVGGGPGGVFAALQSKAVNPDIKALILEKGNAILSKVKISGGGRCNVTNATFDPKELSLKYPRGNKELISAFHQFQPSDMMNWLKERGVDLKIEKDRKVFPETNSSQTIIDCFFKEIENKNVEIKFNQNISKILKKNDFFEITLENQEKIFSKKVILATGSNPIGIKYAKELGHTIEKIIPSLFSFKIKEKEILKLSGISQKDVRVSLKNSPYTQVGDILITHEGFSGPSIITLSSFGAKFLHEKNYKNALLINWLNNFSKDQIMQELLKVKKQHPKKMLIHINPFQFPKKLFSYFLNSFGDVLFVPMQKLSDKNLMKLITKLTSDEYSIISKSTNKSEFVSCGGINLKEVNFKDMQSKICPNLYFVGEILNIDGITGGYNFQNAWTTGFIAGSSL